MTVTPDAPKESRNMPVPANDADLAIARRVLEIEATALHELAESLNGEFCKAINLIEGLKGRLVVTGMGKSGHIAKKIARDLCIDRDTVLFCPSRRGQPRRSWHDWQG